MRQLLATSPEASRTILYCGDGDQCRPLPKAIQSKGIAEMMGSEFLSLLSAVTKLNVALVVDVPLTLSATRLLAVASAAVTLAFTNMGVREWLWERHQFQGGRFAARGGGIAARWIVKFQSSTCPY
ncbi:hypothetical protein [Xylella fastidiosa]|uniref:hypothetical protein n=1 Tax=Xylella fastidiosa TaxID=2371 RepID=UPI0039852EBC